MVPGELEDHLLLLDRVEAGLPYVIGRLAERLVNLGAERISSPFLDPVGLDQSGLYQPFQDFARSGLVALNIAGQTLRDANLMNS
jgi:hypothetical protein